MLGNRLEAGGGGRGVMELGAFLMFADLAALL